MATAKIHLKLSGYSVLCATQASAHVAPQFAVATAAEFRRLYQSDEHGEMCAKCAAKLAKMQRR